jgi:hypothetical protein
MPLTARQELLSAVLSRFGGPRTGTFKDRLTAQKTVYFLQVLGLYCGYRFSWYIYGPYSPDLSRDLYALGDKKADLAVPTAVEQVVAAFDDKLGAVKKSPRNLELLASVHFLAHAYGWNEEKVVSHMERMKPHFPIGQVRGAWKKLGQLGLVGNG